MSGTEMTSDWHKVALGSVFERLTATENGLSESEAQIRRRTHRANRLPELPPPTWWRIILRQFASPLIYVLLLAAIVAMAMGDVKDAGFIGAVLCLNAMIGGYQELKAEKSSQALKRLLEMRAMVLRDGEVRDIRA